MDKDIDWLEDEDVSDEEKEDVKSFTRDHELEDRSANRVDFERDVLGNNS